MKLKAINEKLEVMEDDLTSHEEIQGIFQDIGIKNVNMMTSGNNGTVYDAGDSIVKVTGDATEYANSKKLAGQNNTGAVNIYSVYKLEEDYSNLASGNSFYLIIMEKIKPVEGMLEKIGNIIGENLSYPFTVQEKSRLKSLVSRQIRGITRHRKLSHKLEEILDAIESLAEYGILLEDFHGENLGLDQSGNIKIFDLGSK